MVRAKRVDGFKINTDLLDDEAVFESEEEARESVNIEEVTQYQCDECDEMYDDKEDATECCKD
jgi:hypothetical protein